MWSLCKEFIDHKLNDQTNKQPISVTNMSTAVADPARLPVVHFGMIARSIAIFKLIDPGFFP